MPRSKADALSVANPTVKVSQDGLPKQTLHSTRTESASADGETYEPFLKMLRRRAERSKSSKGQDQVWNRGVGQRKDQGAEFGVMVVCNWDGRWTVFLSLIADGTEGATRTPAEGSAVRQEWDDRGWGQARQGRTSFSFFSVPFLFRMVATGN